MLGGSSGAGCNNNHIDMLSWPCDAKATHTHTHTCDAKEGKKSDPFFASETAKTNVLFE